MSTTREARTATVAGDPSAASGLFLVAFYSDFLSEGGKLCPLVKSIAEEDERSLAAVRRA